MGCFNIAGFFTNQMIVSGNPVVGFLCCSFDVPKKHYDGTVELMHYAIPLSMPIFGKYDDYGRIEDIEESPVTKKLEEFFGYDIDTIMSDVYDFSIDQWLEPWDKEGRYGQVRDGRAKDPNYTFMKEEFDRYVPKYEHLRDLVTRYNTLDKTDEMGEPSFALSLALRIAKENNVSEDAAIEELRKNSWKDIEKKNFNVFWAIDHAALWKAFSAEYDPEDYDADEDYDEDEESADSMMNWLKSYCPVRTDVYDGRYETIPGMDKYVLYVCNEPSMLKEFTKFMRTASNNLEFHFRRPHNYNQSWDMEEYAALNRMILEDTDE